MDMQKFFADFTETKFVEAYKAEPKPAAEPKAEAEVKPAAEAKPAEETKS
jgi:hypothetical protein